MAVKSIAVLLIPFLVIVTVELKSSKPKNCKLAVPSKCINNSVIMVNKTAEKYIIQLNASLCHNGYCIPDYEYTYRSNCEDICNLCKLLQLTDCKKCEDKVDKYLNNLCAKITSMVTLFNITNTTVTTVTQPCPMSTNGVSWMTTTNTPKTTCTNRSTCNPSGSQYSTTTSHRQTASTTHTPTQSTESQSAVNTMPVQVLGALLGLSMVLLVIVTTGWVCTCLFMKNSKVKMNCVQDRSTDDSDEKYFDNPTYDGITTSTTELVRAPGPNAPVASQQAFPRVTYAMYDAVNTASPKTTGKGQTYDILNWRKANGKSSAARNMRTPQGGEGYSQLSLLDKDVENNYHLISKDND